MSVYSLYLYSIRPIVGWCARWLLFVDGISNPKNSANRSYVKVIAFWHQKQRTTYGSGHRGWILWRWVWWVRLKNCIFLISSIIEYDKASIKNWSAIEIYFFLFWSWFHYVSVQLARIEIKKIKILWREWYSRLTSIILCVYSCKYVKYYRIIGSRWRL